MAYETRKAARGRRGGAGAVRSFAALADPTRRRLYDHLRRGPHAVGELARRLGVSQPAVSQHLRVLEGARLVRGRPDGRRRVYRADPRGLWALARAVDRMWSEALSAYAASFEAAGDGGEETW